MDAKLKVFWLSNENFWAAVAAHSEEEAIAFLGEYPQPDDMEPYHLFRVTEDNLGRQPGLIDSGAEGN